MEINEAVRLAHLVHDMRTQIHVMDHEGMGYLVRKALFKAELKLSTIQTLMTVAQRTQFLKQVNPGPAIDA
jgi:hypothetical protein